MLETWKAQHAGEEYTILLDFTSVTTDISSLSKHNPTKQKTKSHHLM
jgi:hypothetical protein